MQINALRPLALALLFVTTLSHAQLYISDPAQYGTALFPISSCDDCNQEVLFSGTGQSLTFFGTVYSSLFVASNGFLTFGTSYSGYNPEPLDTQGFAPMIAGLFTDLDTRPARSNIYLNDATPGQVVITWENVSTFNQDSTNSTFQLVVRSDQFSVPGGEGRIGFFYGEVGSPRNVTAGFGDGLAAVNPGEVSLFTGPASGLSERAPTWFSLGAGGVPEEDPGAATVTAIPTLSEWAMISMSLLMALGGLLMLRRRQV